MRRSTRLGIAAAILLLLMLGAYTAGWFYVAGRVADSIGGWAEEMRAQNLDLSWRGIRVAGYPLAFRIELTEARLRDTASGPAGPGGELRAPFLTGSARPWNFQVWLLSAPDGISGAAGPADAPLARLTARTADASVAVSGQGGATIWLGLGEPVVDAGMRLAARDAALWVKLPQHPPRTHTEPAIGLALQLREVSLPAVPAPLRNPVDEIALGLTTKGEILPGVPRQAAQAWRDAGGTIELDHASVRWGALAITGSGTAALDSELQPEGAFSGRIEGADALLAAFVAAGRMRASDARLARLALSVLAKPGPDGRPQIATSFTIQNGQMSLGGIKLGKAPRIPWE
jgi:hypothetical protein